MDLDSGCERQSPTPTVNPPLTPASFMGTKTNVSRLEEYCASRKENSPHYQVIDEEGPPHLKIFTTRCTLGTVNVSGRGTTKKLAKQNAAASMLHHLEIYSSSADEVTPIENNINALHLGPKNDLTSTPLVTDKIPPYSTILRPSNTAEAPPDIARSSDTNDPQLKMKLSINQGKQDPCFCSECVIRKEPSLLQGAPSSSSRSSATPRISTPPIPGWNLSAEDDIFQIAPPTSFEHSAAKLSCASKTLQLTLKEYPFFSNLFEISQYGVKLAIDFHAFNVASRQHLQRLDPNTKKDQRIETQKIRQQLTSDYANIQLLLNNRVLFHAGRITQNTQQW